MTQLYDADFYSSIASGSKASAMRLLSIYARFATVESVLDIGCGAATWLESAQQVFSLSADQLTGLDGVYAKPAHAGKQFRFVYQDLQERVDLSGEQFDLMVCVEVAEHLPVSRADSFVRELVSHGNSIIFGAAIPNQGGTGHVNEQWPDYWANKFAEHGYVQLDMFRMELWDAKEVMGWYSQNTFLYVKAESSQHQALVARGVLNQVRLPDRVVHPSVFGLAACESAGVRRLAKALPKAVGRTILSLIRRAL